MNRFAGEQIPDDVGSVIDDSADYVDSDKDIYPLASDSDK